MAEDKPRERVFGTLLFNALTRWESAATLVITLFLFAFVGNQNILGIEWQSWMWLVLGAIAEGVFVVSTLTDPEATEEALAKDFEKQFDLSEIRNRVSRERLRDALEYRRNMLKLVHSHKGAMRVSLRQTVSDINDWISHMHSLARHIDAFEGNQLVERDLRMVPQQIDKVKIRIEREKDPSVRRDLENQLKQLEQQQINLQATQNSVRRAEIQLESTLSSLGTIYAQMSLLGTKEVDSARAQRLRLEIQDEVSSLQDTIEAMDEVHQQSLRLK